MTAHRFTVIVEHDEQENAWVTYVPSLGLSTYGESRDEALDQTREAITGYLEAAATAGVPVPSGDTSSEVVEVEVAV